MRIVFHTLRQDTERVLNIYIAVCLLLALFVLTILGVGTPLLVGALGLALSLMGLIQVEAVEADVRILLPLLGYQLFSTLSSWRTYGNMVEGFASTQLIFPVLLLLLARLDGGGRLLLRRLCALWAAAVAAEGLLRFVHRAVTQDVRRLGGLLGNPNAMGIFLVVGWAALMSCPPAGGREAGVWRALLPRLEPVLLAALALTLSMGSFLAMAAAILTLTVCTCRERHSPRREALALLCRLLARASLGVGGGILLYLAAARTGAPWLCLPLLAWVLAAALCWKQVGLFLEAYPRMALLLAAMGVLVAAAAVAVRPSSISTFAERLEMMRNGLGYLLREPLLGVGPYQWRLMNLYDSDTYFNTYHIHNALLHVGVELGLPAMGLLADAAARSFRRADAPGQKAALSAFFLHSMMDTGFFYLGITALALLTAGGAAGRRRLPALWVKLLFGGFALLFVCNLWHVYAGQGR